MPDEVAAQKDAQGQEEYGDEYYDEEEDKEEEKEEEEDKDDDEEEEKKDVEEEKKEEDKKEGDDEYDEDAYGEEDYDEEGKYIWGKEGAEWDFYYKEDKDAFERGDPVHPAVINTKPIRDITAIKDDDGISLASTATGSSNGMYKTKKKAAAGTWKPQ